MFSPQRKNIGNRAGLIVGLICWAVLLGPGAVALAQTQCEAELAEAKKKYESSLFDEAIDLVDRCLNKSGLSESTQLQAYRLKVLAYQAKDYAGQAREAVRKLLQLAPNYKPDPIQDPPPYIELVDQVQREMQPQPTEPAPTIQPKKKGSGKWFLIGGLVVAGGAGAALALGGGGGGGATPPPTSPQLPTPPPLP